MKNIKLLVFDVDGTLYDLVHHEIPSSAIKAIQQAKEKGYSFVIATGRTHYGLGKALNELNPDYILADSGAVVVDGKGHVISHHDISKKDTQQIIDFANRHDAGLVWKFLDHMYIYSQPEKVDWLRGQMNSDIGKDPFIFDHKQDRHFLDEPQSCSLHAPFSLIEKELIPTTNLDFLPYSKEGFDVVVKGVNKAVGLQDLLDFLNLTPEQVIYFGDNYNDLEAMELAGTSIAMGNAVDAIKEKADFITHSTNENGIWHALEQLNIIE